MARPTIFKHPKFLRLVHVLREPVPHVLGYLECMWHVVYESGNATLGDETDVELACQWPGEAGKLCGLLVQLRFLDVHNGRHAVHDLAHHAPEYVALRAGKEKERQKDKACARCHATFHSTDRRAAYCSDRCRQSAYRQRVKDRYPRCGGVRNEGNARNGPSPTVTSPSHDFSDTSKQSTNAAATKPAPNESSEMITGAVTVTDRYTTPAPAPAPAPSLSLDGGVPPSKDKSEAASAAFPETPHGVVRDGKTPQPDTYPKPLIEFPCDGKVKAWSLTEAHVAEWSAAFPSLDVLGECRKALAWANALPSRRKTARGMPKFLVGWLGRAQDSPRAPTRNGSPSPADHQERRRQQIAALYDDAGNPRKV